MSAPADRDPVPTAPRPRRWWIPAVAIVAAVAVASVVLVLVTRPAEVATAPTPSPTATAPVTPTATPTPTPTVVGAPENVTVYDPAALPAIDVFAVTASMPVDDAPDAPTTGATAQAIDPAGAPIFADPTGEPIAVLPQNLRYGGTIVPVVAETTYWVKVLLPGRQGTPPSGNPAQTTGWLRLADVSLVRSDASVEVSISGRTIDVVTGDARERIADDFGWGADATPTPIGRTFVMHIEVVPSFGYTRGHPLVYLGVQSPTLAGFGGESVAVTAFHYHDNRSGAISNGCLRLSAEAIDRLAQLPLGTPVFIRA